MSETVIEVVEQSPLVSTTLEQTVVDISPHEAPNVEVSEDSTSVSITEQEAVIEINDPEPIQITISECIKDSGAVSTDVPLTISKIYAENISALRVVTAVDAARVEKADIVTFSQAKVLGITLQAGITGFEGEILILGIIEDGSFSFPVNDLLYLGSDGNITNIPPELPTSLFSTTIGHSLGNGAIFIDIKDPIEL